MSGKVKIIADLSTFEPAKELAFGGIGAAYASIGTLEHPSHLLKIDNLTDRDVWISLDGVTDHFVVQRGGFVMDEATNGVVLARSDALYVKRYGSISPTSGSVVVSSVYVI